MGPSGALQFLVVSLRPLLLRKVKCQMACQACFHPTETVDISQIARLYLLTCHHISKFPLGSLSMPKRGHAIIQPAHALPIHGVARGFQGCHRHRSQKITSTSWT